MRQLVGLLILVALVVHFWAWILAAIVLWLIVKAAPVAVAELRAQRETLARRDAAVVARAEEQHRLWLAGDERGLYGLYPPCRAATTGRSMTKLEVLDTRLNAHD